MDTVKRSRTLSVVLTATGEVHTHEEAQVFVHDLNQFVAVQLLEETLAVPSLGKLCEDQGYSNQWVSGQKPRLTKQGRKISCLLSQDCRQAGLIEQLFEKRSDEQTSGNRSDNPKKQK